MRFSNHDDTISSDDIIERIEELESELESELETLKDADPEAELDDGDAAELKNLKEIIEKMGSAATREHETLIRESYWEDYVEQLCEEIGDIPKDLPAYIHIDWKWTAREIAMDYSTVELDGISYYYRNC